MLKILSHTNLRICLHDGGPVYTPRKTSLIKKKSEASELADLLQTTICGSPVYTLIKNFIWKLKPAK